MQHFTRLTRSYLPTVALSLLCVSFAAPTLAQEVAKVVSSAKECVATSTLQPSAALLAKSYYTGQWDLLQRDIRDILANRRNPVGDVLPISGATVVSVVATSPVAKDPELVRILVDQEPYVARLHGSETITEVFVSTDPSHRANSLYVFKPGRNPLEAALIEFTKKVALADFSDIVQQKTSSQRARSVRPPTLPCNPGADLFLEITQYRWSGTRGTIGSSSSVILGPQPLGPLKLASAQLGRELRTQEARLSLCAQALVATLDTTSQEYVNALVNAQGTNPADPASVLLAELRKIPALATLVGAASKAPSLADLLAKRSYDHVSTDAQCNSELLPTAALVEAKNNAVIAVQDQFIAFAKGATLDGRERVSSTVTMENVPLAHWSLGLVAAAIVDEAGADRAKVSDAGLVARDPLKGDLSIGVIHWHPRAFDPGRSTLSKAERFRAFAGYTFAPDPGVAVGASLLLFRGLSVNAGYAWLQVRTPADSLAFGDPAPKDKSPLDRRVRGVSFVGFGYSF